MRRRRPELFHGERIPPLSAPWALATAFLAVLLALFAIVRVDFGHSSLLSFRHHERWRSAEMLRVKVPLAPLGPSSHSGLYAFYAQLAASLNVREIVLRSGPLHGSYRAFVSVDHVPATPSQPDRCNEATHLITCTSVAFDAAPSLEIEATARTKTYATATAARVSRGFRTYVRTQQDAASIPSQQRVDFLLVSGAGSNTRRIGSHHVIGPSVALAAVLTLLTLALISGRRSHTSR
jgi:hypothetical protein